MQQKCSRYAADIQQKCSRNAAEMQQKCSRNAAEMQQECSRIAAGMQQECSNSSSTGHALDLLNMLASAVCPCLLRLHIHVKSCFTKFCFDFCCLFHAADHPEAADA
jgi:hypothetical protein